VNKRYNITVNGDTFATDLIARDNQSITIAINGEIHRIEVQALIEFSGQITSNIAPVQAPQSLNAAPIIAAPGTVVAPMPGIISKVMINPGDNKNSGDLLLVIEAMKMENNICINQAGTIKSVLVKAGDEVKKGQVLVELK
jgi:biotin carboxyl carrier protein